MKTSRLLPLAALAALLVGIPTFAIAQDPEEIPYSLQPLTASERESVRKAARLRAESRPLTAEERAIIESQIRMLRAQGLEEDAVYLENLLYTGNIRMAPQSTMDATIKGAGLIATSEGDLYISGDWFRETLARRGGRAYLGSALVHEIVHIKQFEAYDTMKANGGQVYWNPDQNEVTAYTRQLEYLTRLRDTTQDPRLRAYYDARIAFVRAKIRAHQAAAALPGAGKLMPRRGPSTLLLTSYNETPNMKPFQTASVAAIVATAPALMLSASPEFVQPNPTLAMQQTTPPTTTTTDEPVMYGTMESGVQSDAIAMDHADAVTFLWELTEKNGGLIPAYDSSTWTVAQYEAALGRTLDAEEAASVQGLLDSPAAFRTSQDVVGETLASQATGVPVLSVQGRTTDFTLTYGVDKDMEIVGSLLTGQSTTGTTPPPPATR